MVKGTGYQLRERARELLAAARILVMILDESNHVAEARSTRSTQTKANRLTADWIKEIVDEAKVSVVLSGLPHSRRLITDNEQLEGRALRPIELRPYAWHLDADRAAFREFVYAFAGQARANGWTIGVPDDKLARATYMKARGLARPVRRLFERSVLLGGTSMDMSSQCFARAHEQCFQETLLGNPFELEEITDEMLNTAHRQLLQAAHEPAPRGRTHRGASMATPTQIEKTVPFPDESLASYLGRFARDNWIDSRRALLQELEVPHAIRLGVADLSRLGQALGLEPEALL